ncbi:MAG: helix-turn-helix domain-containing protein [Candidatus Bipolaricaulaceae bacterium]
MLITTLRTYLECGRNLRHTAETLRIHYNTARYRINPGRKLIGPAWTTPPAASPWKWPSTSSFSSTPLDLAKLAKKGWPSFVRALPFPLPQPPTITPG